MTHPQLVKALVKPAEEISDNISPHTAQLLHMVLGIAGEAGELVDAIKKMAIYNKPLDLDNVEEELGDLEFYMEGLRQELDLNREIILQKNIQKLQKRYGEKYSDKAAQERADKNFV